MIEYIKKLSMERGFKAIIPVSDRYSMDGTSTTFGCNMAGVCKGLRRELVAQKCPFRISYRKVFMIGVYMIEEIFPYHNHTLN